MCLTLFALSSCDKSKTPAETPTETQTETPVVTPAEPVATTAEARELLEGETYNFSTAISGGTIKVIRVGTNLYYNVWGNTNHIINGNKYQVEDDEKKAFYSPISDEQFEEQLRMFSAHSVFEGLVYSAGGRVTDTGEAEFNGETLRYEEITGSDDVKRLVFFDDRGTVGLVQPGRDGEMVELEFKVNRDIPEGLFEIPEDYELIPE